MNGAAWLLMMATIGLDYGWRVDADGQLEYIIQIPPSQLQTLSENPEGISSSLPPEVVRHVRRFRIVVGNAALPRDALPAFPADGQTLGGVTPINVDASRVNPAGGELGTGGEFSSGFETPALESSVTPLDGAGLPRNALPGPVTELPGNPADVIGDFLPITPLPRGDDRRPGFGSPLASTVMTPGAMIRRDDPQADFRPNVSAPDARDTRPVGTSISRGSDPSATLPPRELSNPFSLDDPYARSGKEKPYGALAAAVCALCLSIGANIYLGWIAWGYYLKYRESFESWRGGWSSPS